MKTKFTIILGVAAAAAFFDIGYTYSNTPSVDPNVPGSQTPPCIDEKEINNCEYIEYIYIQDEYFIMCIKISLCGRSASLNVCPSVADYPKVRDSQ